MTKQAAYNIMLLSDHDDHSLLFFEQKRLDNPRVHDITYLVENVVCGGALKEPGSTTMSLTLEELLHYHIRKDPNNVSSIRSVSNFQRADTLNFWQIFSKITSVFIRYNCRDTEIIARVLALGYQMCDHYCEFWNRLDEMIRWIATSTDRRFQYSRVDYKQIHRIQKFLITPQQSDYVGDTRYDLVKKTATAGNFGYLEVLLNFGLIMQKPIDSYNEMYYTKDVITQLFAGESILRSRGSEYFVDSLKQKFDSISRRRLYLVMRVLEIFTKILSQVTHAEIYTATVRLFFQSIPDPIVTSQEIKSGLEKLLHGAVENEKILQKCKQFEKYFPESCEPIAPRSLKVLSRWRVRESLRAARYLPSGVKYLNVPRPIKKCILLKNCKYLDSTPIMAVDYYSGFPRISTKTPCVLYYVKEEDQDVY